MSVDHVQRKGPINRPSELPGYQLPLNFATNGNCYEVGIFPSAVNSLDVDSGEARGRVLPVRELQMLRLMDRITDKPLWETKVFDDTIAKKWKAEALADQSLGFVESMTDWVIDELRWKAKSAQRDGFVDVYPGDVVKSDTAVPETVRTLLQRAIRVLENIPEKDKDWHPGSNNQVLDLVHPSLFPLVYGTTRILPEGLVPLHSCKAFIGKGDVLPKPLPEHSSHGEGHGWRVQEVDAYSRKFQWLPCDVRRRVPTEDQNPNPPSQWQITSYINNLDPDRHADLYHVVEQVISAAVPLWNKTLDQLRDEPSVPRIERVQYGSVEYKTGTDPLDLLWAEIDARDEETNGGDDDGIEEGSDEFYEKVERERRQALVLPVPGLFQPPEDPDVQYQQLDLAEQFGESGLQIIVKLANIELSPESPEYGGGSWHVEGQLNEHIIATALYYYDNENITDSHLSFRHLGSSDDIEEVSYAQNDHGWLESIFGLSQYEPPLQTLGSVLCCQNRLLTFPNILHHRVDPFKLADVSRPGHRKILALFLVDPNIRVISTANVPPQQRHWWRESLEKQNETRIGLLPPEMRERIQESLADDDFPPSLEKAKVWRKELMAERKTFVGKKDAEFSGFEISLCEH